MLSIWRCCTAQARSTLLAATNITAAELRSQLASPSTSPLYAALGLCTRGLKKQAPQVRAGDLVQRDGRPFRVVRFHWAHGTARASGSIHLDYVDIVTGARTSEKLRLEDQVELADVEEREMQVLYTDDDGNVHVMDGSTYDQTVLSPDMFGEGRRWLAVPDLNVTVSYFHGEPVAAKVPYKLTVQVHHAPDAVAKDDGSITRHVTVDGGISVVAPQFVHKGDKIVVRTDDASYMTKAT